MDDIYSWILSPEIREYLRGHYKPDLMEQQALICGAYRPIEEKLYALQTLCGEAETEEERTSLERAIERYQLAIREIRQCRQDEFYLSRTALQFGGDTWLYAYPFNYLGEIKTDISRSYEELSGGDPSVYCPVSCGYQVKKWRCGKVWEMAADLTRSMVRFLALEFLKVIRCLHSSLLLLYRTNPLENPQHRDC